jgi:hypothetical protein
MVVALLALFVALDGPATAARLIDGKHIKRNSITSKQVRNGSLSASDLSRKARASLRKTPERSIAARHLQNHAITGDKLAGGAVDGRVIADGSITGFDLGAGLIGAGHIAPGAVTATKLADGSIGADAIADGSLTTADLGDFAGTVTIDFKPFGINECQTAEVNPVPTAPGAGAQINDDVILVTPQAGFSDVITVSGTPGVNNTLRIIACRVGKDTRPGRNPDDPIDPPPAQFFYLGIDQP